MIIDGERIKALLKKAERDVILCAPFIKERAIRTLLAVIDSRVSVRVITRWRAIEVAAGVSDLAVMDAVKDRPQTTLRLLDNLHAKLYKADEVCLVGSANLTAAALGWSSRSNIELLIESTKDDPNVRLLLQKINASIPATTEIRDGIEKELESIVTQRLPEGEEILADSIEDRSLSWLPKCAAPAKLFEIYSNTEGSTVIRQTVEEAKSDLLDLGTSSGMKHDEFYRDIRGALLLMPAFAGIVERIPERLSDAKGEAIIRDCRPQYSEDNVKYQWVIIRDWISEFFGDDFEIATDTFIIRIRSR